MTKQPYGETLPFREAMRKFRNAGGKTRIAIFKPLAAENDAVYRELEECLSKEHCTAVVDYIFLFSHEALFNDYIDILLLPEAALMACDDYENVKDYIKNGGAVIICGSDMLMQQDTDVRMAGFTNPFGITREESDDPLFSYKLCCAHIGLKPYISDVKPTQGQFDADFVRDVPTGMFDITLPRDGVKCNTTSDKRAPEPSRGTVFSERYEVTRNYEILSGYDAFGRRLTTALNYAQNWETGARLCVFPSDYYMSNENPYREQLLKSAVSFCLNKVIVSECMPRYVCYRDGETPQIDYTIQSRAKQEQTVSVQLRISAEAQVFEVHCEHVIPPMGEVSGTAEWEGAVFDSDIYTVEVRAYGGDVLLSKADNAFVIWKEAQIAQGPKVGLGDVNFLTVDGRPTFITGTNYYESHSNSHMWVRPNIAKLNADLKQMAEFGINYIRIHYHPPKWFYDFWMFSYGEVPDIYKDLGESHVPPEKYLRIFDAHIYLCQKYGIIYGGDLLTVSPSELGDPRGWGQAHDYCMCGEKLAAQKEFLDALIPRYLNVPGISWDIFNEPFTILLPVLAANFSKEVVVWVQKIKDHMRTLGDTHPITVGDCVTGFFPFLKSFPEVADYLSPHMYWNTVKNQIHKDYNRIRLNQECWMDSPATPEGDQEQLCKMKVAITDTLRFGFAGFAPWQWTGQLAMWQDKGTYSGEVWDDKLGCCVRHDATLKPSGRFYKDFIRLYRDLDLRHFVEDNKIETTAGVVTLQDVDSCAIGDCYLKLEAEGKLLRGIAKGSAATPEYSFIADDSECSVLFDLTGEKTYVKADAPCTLTIQANGKPIAAKLTDGKIAEEIGTIVAGELRIAIEDWMTYYWLEVTERK